MIPYSVGAVSRRGGTLVLGTIADQDHPPRIEEFVFSTDTKFVLEFTNRTLRFWSNDLLVRDSGGFPLLVTTPWAWNELADIDWHQLNDVVLFAHPDHPPQVLTRLADDNWTMETVGYDWPPMRDENPDNDITLDLAATSGSGVALTASEDVFDDGHVGAYYQIGHHRPSPAVKFYILDPTIAPGIGDPPAGSQPRPLLAKVKGSCRNWTA